MAGISASPRLRALHTCIVAAALVLATGASAGAAGDRRIVDAARHRDTPAVRVLIREGRDVNAAQPDGTTALHWAAHWDDVEVLDLLIRAGANVNTATDLGVTPLFLACEHGSAAVIQRLLAGGARPDAALPSGETALMTAARSGNEAAVRALLTAGANANAAERVQGQTALMWAVAQHHAPVVRLLLAHGADVHARSRTTSARVNRADPFNNQARRTTPRVYEVKRGGFTPLLFAARSGDVDAAAALLAAGAAVNQPAADGSTPLVIAAYSGQTGVALRLLEGGADPNLAGAGYTALHAAVLRADARLVSALLARGARPDDRLVNGTAMRRYSQDYVLPDGFAGATPLFLAARFGEAEIARSLLGAGADPNVSANEGTTPLMQAAGVRLDIGGLRPLPPTATDGDDQRASELAKALLDAGADVKARNGAGDTALHGSAARGWNATVRLLVDRGAAVEAANKAGMTPLKVVPRATAGTAVPTADLLRSLGARD